MLYRSYLQFLTLSILSCALSVTFSQVFLGITFLLWLFLPKKPSLRSPISYLLSFFYLWQLTVYFGLGFSSENPLASLALGARQEMKDILLVTAFIVVQAVKKEDQARLTQSFSRMGWLLLLTGAISIFSETRLARLISDLYQSNSSWPFQHHYGNPMGVSLYLPIGLMNTHLTYGGLLSLVTPYFFFTFLWAWEKKESFTNLAKKFSPFLLIIPITLLNNARSAILGTIVSLVVGLCVLFWIRKDLGKRSLYLLSSGFLGVLILFSFAFFFVPVVQKTIKPLLGDEKHTDSGRTFIWNSTFPIIAKNPIFGIGPGNYGKAIEDSRKSLSMANPDLLFFYEVTQRGHSHNDIFHQTVIFGLPAAVLFIALGFRIVYELSSGFCHYPALFLGFSLSGFFFSGLLQCYFQDDEVLIFFYFLLGQFILFRERSGEWKA